MTDKSVGSKQWCNEERLTHANDGRLSSIEKRLSLLETIWRDGWKHENIVCNATPEAEKPLHKYVDKNGNDVYVDYGNSRSDTITIDRKVAEEWLKYIMVESNEIPNVDDGKIVAEIKKALGK